MNLSDRTGIRNALFIGGLLVLLSAQPLLATRVMGGMYLQFTHYVVDWGTMSQAEKNTYVELDPVLGYARVRPRLQNLDEGGEMELYWNAEQWPKLIVLGDVVLVDLKGRIAYRPALGSGICLNASADRTFFNSTIPVERAYWFINQCAGRYSEGLREGSRQMPLTLKDLGLIDPSIKQTAIGIWLDPVGPHVTYYYDVVRNVGNAPPSVNPPPPTPGGGGASPAVPPAEGGLPAGSERERCDRYARSADLHHQENLKLNCGYTGDRWQVNYDGHFNWCLGVERALAESETRVREGELDQCRRKNAPVGSGSATGNGASLTYIGCFRDQGDDYGTDGRDLNGYYARGDDMTAQRCVALCREKGFAYAGTQYGAQCFCGNGYGRSGPADNCDVPCAGDRGQVCGGGWANSVYATGVAIR